MIHAESLYIEVSLVFLLFITVFFQMNEQTTRAEVYRWVKSIKEYDKTTDTEIQHTKIGTKIHNMDG